MLLLWHESAIAWASDCFRVPWPWAQSALAVVARVQWGACSPITSPAPVPGPCRGTVMVYAQTSETSHTGRSKLDLCQLANQNVTCNRNTCTVVLRYDKAGADLGVGGCKASRFTVCPKADALFPIVSAASIVAKVTACLLSASNFAVESSRRVLGGHRVRYGAQRFEGPTRAVRVEQRMCLQ